jgi:hypothetical protein
MNNRKPVRNYGILHLLSCAAAATADVHIPTAKASKTTVDTACHLESLSVLFKLYITNSRKSYSNTPHLIVQQLADSSC